MDRREEQSLRGRIIVSGLFIAFTLLLMVSFYTEYEGNPVQRSNGEVVQRDLPSVGEGQNISLEEVSSDPNAFVGKAVSVRGLVQENIGTRGLTLESSESETENLLVISREALVGVGGGPGVAEYTESEGVRVSGIVRTFNLAELEKELGVDLNEDIYKKYEGKHVLVAHSIASLQNR